MLMHDTGQSRSTPPLLLNRATGVPGATYAELYSGIIDRAISPYCAFHAATFRDTWRTTDGIACTRMGVPIVQPAPPAHPVRDATYCSVEGLPPVVRTHVSMTRPQLQLDGRGLCTTSRYDRLMSLDAWPLASEVPL